MTRIAEIDLTNDHRIADPFVGGFASLAPHLLASNDPLFVKSDNTVSADFNSWHFMRSTAMELDVARQFDIDVQTALIQDFNVGFPYPLFRLYSSEIVYRYNNELGVPLYEVHLIYVLLNPRGMGDIPWQGGSLASFSSVPARFGIPASPERKRMAQLSKPYTQAEFQARGSASTLEVVLDALEVDKHFNNTIREHGISVEHLRPDTAA